MPTDQLLNLAWLVLASIIGLALPIGLARSAARAGPQKDRPSADRPAAGRQVAGRLLLAGLLAFLMALGVGFSLQYGALHLPQVGDPSHLAWQWAPLGPGSGLLAWAGPGLPGSTAPARMALFLLQALGTVTVVTLALAPLARRLPGPGLVGAAVLIGGLLYPLLGHWAWGRGWLAATGRTAYLGHGFVDPGGSGVQYALGGLLALAGLVAIRAWGTNSPQIEHPALGGTLLALLGMTVLHAASLREVTPRVALVVANTWSGAAAGGVVAAVYMAFTSTRLRPAMLARGLLAGAAASGGIAPFAPPTTLLLVGAVAGLLAVLGSYLVEQVWHLDDPGGVVASFGLGGLWGTLAVGLLADGTFGQGLHGVGGGRYLGVSGQGVSGIALLAPGIVPDYGQLTAQVLGLLVIVVWALAPGWLLFRLGSIQPERAGQGSNSAHAGPAQIEETARGGTGPAAADETSPSPEEEPAIEEDTESA